MTNLKKYEMTMRAGLVPFVQGRPGEAKSATFARIAKVNNYQYFDIRLSTKDETELGSYPIIKDGVLTHAVPEWAKKAKDYKALGYDGSLIHFEELNRCSIEKRNAALGILQERVIADQNDYLKDENIWMCATGNMGAEDGTEVEEFDTALNGRLTHFEHTLTIDEWVSEFARENVNKYIIQFLEAKPEYFWTNNNGKDEKAYASARTWTSFSKLIEQMKGENKIESILTNLGYFARPTVGTSGDIFLTWLVKKIDNESRITYKDILNGKINKITKKEFQETYNGDVIADIINNLKTVEITAAKNTEVRNIAKFLAVIGEDEAVGYINDITIMLDLEDRYDLINIFETELPELMTAILEDVKAGF